MARLGGRPTKLTQEVHQKIVDALSGGTYFETACAFAGVSSSTGRDWMRRGARAKTGIYRAFHDDVDAARARAEVALLMSINRSGATFWQARAWILERTHPERYSLRQRVDVNEVGKVQITVTEPGVPEADARAHHTDDDLDG